MKQALLIAISLMIGNAALAICPMNASLHAATAVQNEKQTVYKASTNSGNAEGQQQQRGH